MNSLKSARVSPLLILITVAKALGEIAIHLFTWAAFILLAGIACGWWQ